MTVGGDVRAQARKGPADATTKVVSEAEAEAAWGEGGSPSGSLEDRQSGRALPTKGIRCVSPGGPDAENAPDPRAMANLAARRARQGKPGSPSRAPQKAAQATPPVEDWEVAVQAEMQKAASGALPPAEISAPAPARTQSGMEITQNGDIVERARRRSLSVLSSLPRGTELYIREVTTQDTIEIMMGIGMLIGKGHATYRDGGFYRITDEGWQQALREKP